jgi:hypothetical protein
MRAPRFNRRFLRQRRDVETGGYREDTKSLKIAHAMVRNRPDAIDEWTVAAYVRMNEKRAQKAWTDLGRELFHRVTIPGPQAETFIQARLGGWIPV